MNINNLCYWCFSEKPIAEKPCPKCGYQQKKDSSAANRLRPGTLLSDRYVVGEALGAGGFGITYKCLDTQFGAICAVKEYYPMSLAMRSSGSDTVLVSSDNLERYNKHLKRFVDESNLLKTLRHPNIITTYDSFFANNTAYYVMEYCDGVNLRAYSSNFKKRISYDEGLNIYWQIMNGLEYVHNMGIFHRDIAPDNVYVTKGNNVKILDFGSARREMQQQSREFSVILKVGYAPLEQYGGRGRQGAFTDIYALGATFYHLFTGTIPVESTERAAQDSLIPFSRLRPDLPASFKFCIERSMALRSADRPQTIGDLKKILAIQNPDSTNTQKSTQSQKNVQSQNNVQSQKSVQTSKSDVQSNTPVSPKVPKQPKMPKPKKLKVPKVKRQKVPKVKNAKKPIRLVRISKTPISASRRWGGNREASLANRAAAYLIDVFIWALMYFSVLYMCLGVVDEIYLFFSVFFPVVFTIVNISLELIMAKTLGKAMLKLYVRGKVYVNVEPGEIILRNLIKLLGPFVVLTYNDGCLLEDKTNSVVCIDE